MAKNTPETGAKQSPQKSPTEQLIEIRKQLVDRESALLHTLNELGYTGINFEDFLRIEPDIDKDHVLTQQILEVQEDIQSFLLEQKYWHNVICIEPSKLHIAVDDAEKLLALHTECNIFQQSGSLVRIIQHAVTPNSAEKTTHDIVMIAPLDQNQLTLLLTKIGHFVKYDGRVKTFVGIDCPEKVARSLLCKQEWVNIRVLNGITTIPTLRPDGSILENHGYDIQSGLIYMPDECTVEKIPENPSSDEIQQAKDDLLEIYAEFPFENEASRSVVLAAVLTALTRDSYPTAPLFAFSAPKMASGKTLLADTVSYIKTGRRNSVISQAENETEEKKRLLALLLERAAIICYDNVERKFESATLCAILTQCTYKDRKLGISENRAASTSSTFLVTGNNLVFAGDISTRVLLCNLHPQEERPEHRTFTKDLHTHIPANRGRFIRSALILLRAYFAAGKPKQNIPTFARFEKWSDTVRSALVYLGMADPYLNQQDIESADPIRILLKDLFSSWFRIFGDMPIKARELLAVNHMNDGEAAIILKESISHLVGSNKKGEISALVLGSKLRSYQNRVENGLKLEQIGEKQGTTLWHIKNVNA